MATPLQQFLLTLLAVSHLTAGATATSVLKLPISKQSRPKLPSESTLAIKRPISAPLHDVHFNTYYIVNLTIGTPPQNVALDIDTGSSDIWIYEPGVCEDSIDSQTEAVMGACVGGSYDPSRSTTSKVLTDDDEAFYIHYADDTTAYGRYVTDVINVNGAEVSNITIASVDHGASNVGIMGVGFAANEAGPAYGDWPVHPTFMDLLKSQGVIKTKAFSMYLNSKDASTGSVLFGGIDTDKFHEPMISLPVISDFYNYTSGNNFSFTVSLTGVGISSAKDGDWILKSNGQLPAPVLLDSGTTISYLPDDMFTTLADYFATVPASYYSDDLRLVTCDLRDTDGTVHFLFGGDNTTSIAIPFSELALPYAYDGQQLEFEDGTPACQFGVSSNNGDVTILGDTFLRSAYVVYDLDNRQVGLAQTRFNSTTENIVELSADETTLPEVSTTATVLPASSVYFDYDSYYGSEGGYGSSYGYATPTESYSDDYGYYSSDRYYGYQTPSASDSGYYYGGYLTARAEPTPTPSPAVQNKDIYDYISLNAGPAPTETPFQVRYLSINAYTTSLPRAKIDLADGERRETSTSSGAGSHVTPMAAAVAGLAVGALAIL